MPTLTDTDREILDLESQWFEFEGVKANVIFERWGMSATRYYQVLSALIDTEAALAYSPLVVNRLRRQRESRQRSRSVRRPS